MMLKIYEQKILPMMVHLVCRQKSIADLRQKIIPSASGTVLEVGMGSGLNLPFYAPEKILKLWGVEPLDKLRRMAKKSAARGGIPLELVGRDGQAMALPDNSADTIVLTYSLCSIPDPVKAVFEMYRILKPGGRLLFCEHGRSPDLKIRRWQERLTPYWQRVSGGCSLDRPVVDLLEEGGFDIQNLDAGYTSDLKIVSYNYTGLARK